MLVFDDLLILFRIAWWTSAGKELNSRLSTCAVLLNVVLFVFVFLSGLVSGKDVEFDCIGS